MMADDSVVSDIDFFGILSQKMPVVTAPNLENLVAIFYDDIAVLGDFKCQWSNAAPAATPADQPSEEFDVSVPKPYANLLAHQNHMTVTVEAFHQSPVDVEVLAEKYEGDLYCRKILLRTQKTGQVVQYGIVRLNTAHLAPVPRDEILAKKIPLGRVLINHDVMRSVQLASLWKVTMGDELSHHFGQTGLDVTYGRTALIYFNNQPSLELLEIVAPVG